MKTLNPNKTISPNGQTLKQRLEESEAQFRETGRYRGLKELSFKASNPILYEKIFSRLRGGLVNAREVAMNISASPIVKEIGELCFAVYTPEGDSVALSTGIIVHVHTMSDAIKFIIRNDYESNPGIASGDIFINNDPVIGDIHNADVQTLVPIFAKGEIVGWSGGVTHEIDIGAVTPGSVPVGPTTRFEDGIDCPAMKCGANDTLFQDHVIRCEKAVRTPMYWKLDERARVAGCHMIRKVVHDIIEDVGLDAYKAFMAEVIEEGRRSFLTRVKELLIPGKYQSPGFSEFDFSKEPRMPLHAQVDKIMHAPLEIEIGKDGLFTVSLEGADAWGYHSMNCTPSGMQGAIWVLLSQMIIPNDKVNDGAYLATKSNFPLGTWTNSGAPHVSTGISWFFLIPGFTGLVKSVSRGFQARGFFEEVLSSYGVSSNCLQGGGIDQYQRESATTNFEMSCVGTGAGMVRDGLDFAAAMWNPEGDMGDVEVWEAIEPFLYLGRRIKPNSAGAGKYRGGSGFESLRMCWQTPYYQLQNINSSKVFSSSGLFGGYPNASGYRKNLHGTNLLENGKLEKPYPTRDGDPAASEIEARVQAKRSVIDRHTTSLPEVFQEGDLYLSLLNGGTGLGDPIERDPKLIEDDLNSGHLLPKYAKPIYGADIEEQNGKWLVDVQKTDANRQRIRDARAQNSMPVKDWIFEERKRVAEGDFIKPVKNMYRSSMALSKPWAEMFRKFWDFSKDFSL